jgi:hypothetical protein
MGDVGGKIKQVNPTIHLEFNRGNTEEGIPVTAIDRNGKATYLGVIIPSEAQLYSVLDKSRNYQTLYKYRVSGKEFVDTKSEFKIQRYAWRNINETEQRILAKGSKSNYRDLPPRPGEPYSTSSFEDAIITHVTNSKVQSRFSSATTNDKGAVTQLATGENFNSYGLIKIDLLEIPREMIVNLSTREAAAHWTIRTGSKNIAKRLPSEVAHTRELLIDGGVRGKAIVEYIPI